MPLPSYINHQCIENIDQLKDFAQRMGENYHVDEEQQAVYYIKHRTGPQEGQENVIRYDTQFRVGFHVYSREGQPDIFYASPTPLTEEEALPRLLREN